MITVKMTRDVFNAKAAQLKAEQGIELTGDVGEVSKEGVVVDYTFDGQEFSASIRHKPVYLTVGFCEGKLLGWLGVAKSS
jgi:hypothetical protein